MSVDKLVDSTQLDSDLTSVANAIRTKGGTSAQLAFPAGFVQAIGEIETGGGGISIDGLVENTEPSGDLHIDTATIIEGYSLYNKNSLTSIHSKSVTSIMPYAIRSTSILTAVFEKLERLYNRSIGECPAVKSIDILGTTANQMFASYAFNNDSALDTLIIRVDGVYPLSGGVNAFTGTPFASGGTGGTLYVPQAQIANYQAATNWVTLLGYANNQILSIEGSQYENYYADGIPITT